MTTPSGALSMLALAASDMTTPSRINPSRSTRFTYSAQQKICSVETCKATKTSIWYRDPKDRTRDLCNSCYQKAIREIREIREIRPHQKPTESSWLRKNPKDASEVSPKTAVEMREALEKCDPICVSDLVKGFSTSLKSDRDLMMLALEKCDPFLVSSLSQHFTKELQNDRPLMKKALEKGDPISLDFLVESFGASLRSDEDLMMVALEKCPSNHVIHVIKAFDPCFRSDPRYMHIAIKKNPSSFPLISPNLQEIIKKNILEDTENGEELQLHSMDHIVHYMSAMTEEKRGFLLSSFTLVFRD